MGTLESRSSEEVVINTEATGKVGVRELGSYYLSFIKGDKDALRGVPPQVPDFKRSDALKNGYKEGDIVEVKVTVIYRISPKIK
jgi:hypothetical protein